MRLKAGTYLFDVGGCNIASESESLIGEDMIQYGFKSRLRVSGWLTETTGSDVQTKLSLAETALRTALKVPGIDLVFLKDDGNESSLTLKNTGSISGVAITRGPNFPATKPGGEFSTIREFNFEAEAEYPLPRTGQRFISFTESLQFMGGGPLFVVRPALSGPPQRQRIYDQTPYIVRQSGAAVGYLARPDPLIVAPPNWPEFLKMEPIIGIDTPKKIGSQYKNYAVTWEYLFESPIQLIGVPNLWPR